MASFGLLFYGPLQHRWYGLLASRFPGTSTGNFLSKVRHSGLLAHMHRHPTQPNECSAGGAHDGVSQPMGTASAQVALNQFALGPVVLAVSFAWNLVLTGQAKKFASKLRNDGPPSMVNGAQQH